MNKIELETLTNFELLGYHRIICNCLDHHEQWKNTLDNKHIRDYYRSVLEYTTEELIHRGLPTHNT